MADDDIITRISLEGADTVASQLSGIGDKGVEAFKKITEAAKQTSEAATSATDKLSSQFAKIGEHERITRGAFANLAGLRSPLSGVGALAGAEVGAATGAGVEAGEVAGRSIFGGQRRIPISLVAREALSLAGIRFPGAGLATHIGVEAAEAGGVLAPTLAIGGIVAGLTALNAVLEHTADVANDATQKLGELFGSRQQGASAFERIRLAAPGLGLTSGQLAAPAEAAAGLARSFVPAYPGQPSPPQYNQASLLSAVESLVSGLKADRVSSEDASKATTDLFTKLQKGFLSEEDLKALEQVSPAAADQLAKAILAHPAAGPGGVYPFSPFQALPAGLTPFQQLESLLKQQPQAVTSATVVQAAASTAPANKAALDTAKSTESLGTAFSSLGSSINAVLGALTPFASFAAAVQAAADAVAKFAAVINRVNAAEPKTPPETPPRVAGTEETRARFRRAQYGFETPAAGAPATRPAPEVTTPEGGPAVAVPTQRHITVTTEPPQGAPPGTAPSKVEYPVPVEGPGGLAPPIGPRGAVTIFQGPVPTTSNVPTQTGATSTPLTQEQGGLPPGAVSVGGQPTTVPKDTGELYAPRGGGELFPGLSLLPALSSLFGGGAKTETGSSQAGSGLQEVAGAAPQAGTALSSLAGIVDQVQGTLVGAFAAVASAAEALASRLGVSLPQPPETPDTAGTRGATGGLFTGLGFMRFAPGGSVGGVGTGKSDSNLALLSRGEFVHQEPAVRHYGAAFMHAVNNMTFPKFSLGGMMDSISSSMNFGVPRLAAGGVASSGSANYLGHYTVDLRTDKGTVSGLRGGQNSIDQLSRAAVDQRMRTTFTGGGPPDWLGGRNS